MPRASDRVAPEIVEIGASAAIPGTVGWMSQSIAANALTAGRLPLHDCAPEAGLFQNQSPHLSHPASMRPSTRTVATAEMRLNMRKPLVFLEHTGLTRRRRAAFPVFWTCFRPAAKPHMKKHRRAGV